MSRRRKKKQQKQQQQQQQQQQGSSTGSTGQGGSTGSNPAGGGNPGSGGNGGTSGGTSGGSTSSSRPNKNDTEIQTFKDKLTKFAGLQDKLADIEKAYQALPDGAKEKVKADYKNFANTQVDSTHVKNLGFGYTNSDIYNDSKFKLTDADINDSTIRNQLSSEAKEGWFKESIKNLSNSGDELTAEEKLLLDEGAISSDTIAEERKDLNKKAALDDYYKDSAANINTTNNNPKNNAFTKNYIESLSIEELNEKLKDPSNKAERERIKEVFDAQETARGTSTKADLSNVEKAWYNNMTSDEVSDFNTTVTDTKVREKFFDDTLNTDAKTFNPAQENYMREHATNAKFKTVNQTHSEAVSTLGWKTRLANDRWKDPLKDNAVEAVKNRYKGFSEGKLPKGKITKGAGGIVGLAGAGLAGQTFNNLADAAHKNYGGTPFKDAAIDTAMYGAMLPAVSGATAGALQNGLTQVADNGIKGLNLANVAKAGYQGAVGGLPETIIGSMINGALDANGMGDSQWHIAGDALNNVGMGMGAASAAALTAAAAAQRQGIKADARHIAKPYEIGENPDKFFITNKQTGKTSVIDNNGLANLIEETKNAGVPIDDAFDIRNAFQARALLQDANKVVEIRDRRASGYGDNIIDQAKNYGVDIARGLADWWGQITGTAQKGVMDLSDEEVANKLSERYNKRLERNVNQVYKAATEGVKDRDGKQLYTAEEVRKNLADFYNSGQMENNAAAQAYYDAINEGFLKQLNEQVQQQQAEQQALSDRYRKELERVSQIPVEELLNY